MYFNYRPTFFFYYLFLFPCTESGIGERKIHLDTHSKPRAQRGITNIIEKMMHVELNLLAYGFNGQGHAPVINSRYYNN